jgi:exodeoxyribonuclease VIII
MMRSGNITAGLDAPQPQNGIHDGVPFEDYLAWPYVSQSTLKPMLTSPAHYRYRIEHPSEDKPCWAFGRICHHGKLEPLEALRRYTVRPDFAQQVIDEDPTVKKPRATSRYRELCAQFDEVNGDKEIVDAEWYERLCGIVDSLNKHALARTWLAADGASELSLVWTEPLTGLTCKSRLDKFPAGEDLIVDLKTIGRDITRFEWDIANFGYDFQAAFYSDAWHVLTGRTLRFGIVVVESNPPHTVRAAIVDDDTLAAGRFKYRKALRQLAECYDRNRWPGPPDPVAWSLPTDAMPTVELTSSGQPITL